MKLRKSSIALIAASSIALLACSGQAFAKTGLVDMQKVYQSPAVQTLMKSGNHNTKALQAAYQSYQTAQAKANKAKGTTKKTLDAKAKKAQTDFQTLMTKQQAAAHAKQKMVMKKVKLAIATASKAKGVSTTLLKQAVIYSAPNQDIDITDAVIKNLAAK